MIRLKPTMKYKFIDYKICEPIALWAILETFPENVVYIRATAILCGREIASIAPIPEGVLSESKEIIDAIAKGIMKDSAEVLYNKSWWKFPFWNLWDKIKKALQENQPGL